MIFGKTHEEADKLQQAHLRSMKGVRVPFFAVIPQFLEDGRCAWLCTIHKELVVYENIHGRLFVSADLFLGNQRYRYYEKKEG